MIADEAAFDRFAQLADGQDEILVYGGAAYRRVILAWAARLGIEAEEVLGENRGCGDHFSALTREILGRFSPEA